MGRISVFFVSCLFITISGLAQHHIGAGGGYNQSIYYTSISKSQYYYVFRPKDSYLVNLSYKMDIPVKKENMRVGTQLEWKRQSAYFYYNDLKNGDTIPTGMNYDIHILQWYVFPELVIGDPIRLIFSGGPVVEYIIYSNAHGIRLIDEKRTEVEKESNNGDIKGLYVGAKLSLGLEFPVYKNFYISLQNSYSAGLSSKGGRLKDSFNYFNCLDINLTASLFYRFNNNKTIIK